MRYWGDAVDAGEAALTGDVVAPALAGVEAGAAAGEVLVVTGVTAAAGAVAGALMPSG